MAVIGKIRQHSTILILVIGIALLAFVLMDAMNSNSNLLGGSDNTVGIINGKEISYKKFSQRLNQEQQTRQLFMGAIGQNDVAQQKIRNETWRKIVRDQLFGQQYKKLGIKVTATELEQLLRGPNPHPLARQFFTNPETGSFDPMQVTRFVQNMNRDQSGRSRQQWHHLKRMIKNGALQSKYRNAVAKGIYVPAWQAKKQKITQTKQVNFDYIRQSYNSIPDTAIHINADDIQNYIQQHRKKYELEQENRAITYAAFPIIPSSQDTADTRQWIKDQVQPFKNAKNDSNFVNLHSDQSFDNDYYTKEGLNTAYADTFFQVDTGKLVGPYFEKGSFKLTKVLNRKKIADSVKVRHILVRVNRREGGRNALQRAKQQVDTLRKYIEERDSSFAALARRYSADGASARKGGDLGWIQPDDMVEPFKDAVFYEGQEGELLKVRTRFGFHLIEILESNPTQPAVQLATVQRKLRPSTQTEDQIFSKASKFAGKAQRKGNFEGLFKSYNITRRQANKIKKNDYKIVGIGPARPVVSWTYKNKKGDISSVINTPDHFVVARITDINEKGSVPTDEIAPQVKVKLRQQKKAEKIIQNIKPAVKNSNKLMEVAQSVNKDISSAYDITFADPYLPDVGREPRVVGKAFGLSSQQLSQPIAGDNGVYVIQIKSFKKAPSTTNYKSYQVQQMRQYETRVRKQLLKALKEAKGVQDRRYKFY